MRVSDSTACFSFTFSLPHPPTTDQWSHPLSLDSARDPPFKSHLPSPFILAIWIIDPMERINHGNLQFLHITGNWFPTDQFDFKCFERRAQQQQVCRGGSERLATCCPVVATILFFVHNYISSSRKHNFSWAKSPHLPIKLWWCYLIVGTTHTSMRTIFCLLHYMHNAHWTLCAVFSCPSF